MIPPLHKTLQSQVHCSCNKNNQTKICNFSFKLGYTCKILFISHFPTLMILKAGSFLKQANEPTDTLSFFLWLNVHICPPSRLFSSPISCNALMQNRSWVDDWCNLFQTITNITIWWHCFRTSSLSLPLYHDHHHHHLMTLTSERGHSATHRSSHGSKEVDKDLARVRLRRWVEEQAGGDEHGDQQEEEPRGHHQHPAEPTTPSQPRG